VSERYQGRARRPPMEASDYRTPIVVQSRVPGKSATGAPAGDWLPVGTVFACLEEARGFQDDAGGGSKTVRPLRLRVRWFPGWEQVIRASRRILLDGTSYDVRGAVEAPGEGTERLLAIEAQAVTP